MKRECPTAHPRRRIVAKQVLRELSPTFAAMYSVVGRPSIPPERPPKSELLIAPYCDGAAGWFASGWPPTSCFAGFFDMELNEPGFEHSTFSQHSERLLPPRRHGSVLMREARSAGGLLSTEHFMGEGTP